MHVGVVLAQVVTGPPVSEGEVVELVGVGLDRAGHHVRAFLGRQDLGGEPVRWDAAVRVRRRPDLEQEVTFAVADAGCAPGLAEAPVHRGAVERPAPHRVPPVAGGDHAVPVYGRCPVASLWR